MTNNTRRTKVARMTLLAMLVAILIVLAYVNIPMPMGLSITFNMIPVAIAAIAMGLPGGMIVGTTLETTMPSTTLVGTFSWANMEVSLTPYSFFAAR